MKIKFVSVFSIGFILLFIIHISSVHAIVPDNHFSIVENEHFHLNHEEFLKLEKQGYEAHDIIKAAHISMYTSKSIESILQYYKEHRSWHETANHFGVDLEQIKTDKMRKTTQLYRENKEKITKFVANYTKNTPEEINQYLKEDVDLHFLIVAAAISKTTHTDLSQIIQYKKDGKSFEEIMNTVNADRKAVFDEVKKLHEKIKQIL